MLKTWKGRRVRTEDEYDYMEEDEDEEEEEDEEETWASIEKKRLAAKKRKWVEAKKRNQQTEAFVRQLLKDDKAGKLDSFKDIPLAKEEKGAEEEEEEAVVDSKRTKKKMDLGAGPSNARPAIETPSTPESSGNGGVVLDYSDLGFLFHFQIGGLVDGKINCMFSFRC
jgi:hypothetical protein